MSFDERVLKTEAVVLRRTEFGESDYLVTVFTPQHGKIKAIAKGARKPTGRKTGHVELYTLTYLIISRGHELHIITQAETQNTFLPLQEDLERGVYASHFVELLDQFTYEGESLPAAFKLIVAGLGWLSDPETDLRLAARYYEYRLLRIMGYEPSLFECAVSGEKLTAQDQFFSVAEGGVVAAQHTAGLEVMHMPLSTFKILRHFSRSSWSKVKVLKISEKDDRNVKHILHTYLIYLLERRLHSASFLEKLKHDLG